MVAARYLVHEGALRHGERVAVACDSGLTTYAELDRRCSRFAAAVEARGVRAADRVALFMDDSVEAVTAICGVLAVGAVLVPVDVRTDAAELASILDDCGATALVTQARLAAAAAAALTAAGSVRLVVLAGGDQGSVSDSCLAFEDAIRRTVSGPNPRVGGATSHPLLLVYPRAAVGLAAPMTLTEVDLLGGRSRESAGAEPRTAPSASLASARGIADMLNIFAAGATLDLSSSAAVLPLRAAAA